MADEFSNYSPELIKSAATAAKYSVQQNSVILTCPAQCTTLSLIFFVRPSILPFQTGVMTLVNNQK